ncbi:uncharacterized protein LOC129771784 isoform X1 [Toxorhynchites rutilus septentrionalis]|uniref:uncharacterized protein LOC129771784 isoform X1 n=1 Tax=Toxorhynchites rutilus septentrionalis TaxID=329112 RepID=UPI002479115D|nr:uncharacterized protein LOC129771784 isoform X1 [Toxorhynchites rutilus septentrionalis]
MSARDKIAYLRKELSHAKDALCRSGEEIEKLKQLLNEMTLGKQDVLNELHTTQQVNTRLARRLDKHRYYLSTLTNEFQYEMKQVRSILKSMQVTSFLFPRTICFETKFFQKSLRVSNRKLTHHMQYCVRTRFQLGKMFFRMRSTKQWCEKQRNRYQQMCFQFAEFVREQNRNMQSIVETKLSNESISMCHRQYLDLLTRCSLLLHENMNLRLLSMHKLDEQEQSSSGGMDVPGSPANYVLSGSEKECAGADENNVSADSLDSLRRRRHSV